MADTLLILALPSFRRLLFFPLSLFSFSPDCWLRSWACQDLVRPFTSRLLMSAPKACCMTCAMHRMWFLNAGHWIAEALIVDCSSPVIGKFGEALWVVIPSKQPTVSSKRSSTSFNRSASLALVWWLLIYHPYLAFETWKGQVIIFIENKLIIT